MTALRQRLIEDIRLRNFSSHTVEAYVRAVAHLARHYGRSPEQISGEEVRQYLLYLVQERRVSWSLYNQTRCALQFFYRVTLGRDEQFQRLPCARKPKRLPGVLSPEELRRLFAVAAHEPKYHALLMTLYGAGLRISEAFDLQIGDIDSQRMLIHVRDGKGHKARMVKHSRSIAESWRTLFAARIMGKRPSCMPAGGYRQPSRPSWHRPTARRILFPCALPIARLKAIPITGIGSVQPSLSAVRDTPPATPGSASARRIDSSSLCSQKTHILGR